MRRGFSLLEVLIVSVLLLTMMALVAVTSSEYARINRFNNTQDSHLEVAQRALSMMAAEASESVRGVAPASAVPLNRIEFDKVDFNPNRLAPPAPATFGPQNDLINIVYQVTGGQLMRHQTVGGVTTSSVVARELTGLSASLASPRRLTFTLSVQKESVIVSTSREVFLWRGAW